MPNTLDPLPVPLPRRDPRIHGNVPLPPEDPRPDATLDRMLQGIMGPGAVQPPTKPRAPVVPMPTSDPRDWATRAINPQVQSENGLGGWIDPHTLMNLRGYEGGQYFGSKGTVFDQDQIDKIMRNSVRGPQRGIGAPQGTSEQDASLMAKLLAG